MMNVVADQIQHLDTLNRELQILDRLNSWLRIPRICTAQPDSDLSVDESRLPDEWTTSLVHRSLAHAVECLTVAGTLIQNQGWMHAPFVLLRGAYESAGLAVWLLEPDSADIRLARLIVQHKDSSEYMKKAYDGTPLELLDEQQQYATQMAKTAGIDLRDGAFRGYQAVIKSLDDFPGQAESLLTAWRLCSGVSHAKTWALNVITTEVSRTQDGEYGHKTVRKSDPILATSLLSVGRRTVERACVLSTIRTTARPHSIQLELTALPLNTADDAH